MKRSTIIAVAVTVLVGFSLPALAREGNQAEIFKWIQPPDMEEGYDLQSQWDATDSEPDIIKADDWMCLDGLPVTDVHWWGSYYDNEEFTPDGFAILIYEDFEDEEKELYRPGTLLEDYYVPFCNANETVFGVDSLGETVYEYTLYLSEDEWFYQDQDTWYWISIVAITPDIGSTPIWGWHTGVELPGMEGTAPAVTGKVDQTCGIPDIPVGNPEEWAWMDYNMAFGLTTIPEPATIGLFGAAAVGLVVLRRRKK
jgi:hypothetical protein